MQNPDETNVLGQKKFVTPFLNTKNKKREFIERNYPLDEAVSLEAQKFQSMVRFDKSLAFNLRDLPYPKFCNKPLFNELILFFSRRHKLNLFNSTEFVIRDFAEKLNYGPNYLYNTHPAVEAGLMKPFVDEDGIVYKNNFDVTLHQLLNTFFSVDNIQSKKDGTRVADKFRYFVIEHLRIKENPRVNKKRTYIATLSRAFVETLAKNYQNIDFDDYVNICSGDRGRETLSPLYLHFSYWHNRLANIHTYTPGFEDLCEMANITAERPAKRKEALGKALDKLSKSKFMPFTYKFTKTKGQRYSYSICIDFLYEPVEEPEKARLIFDVIKKESITLYNSIYGINILNDDYGKDGYHKFELWKGSQYNLSEKQTLVSELSNKLKRNSDILDRGIVESICNHYFEQLIHLN